MNLHPIFVHFPIALLSLYSLMEIFRFKFVTLQPYWFYLKATFVMVGGLFALVANQTGDMAAQAIRQDDYLRPILRLHEMYAKATIAIFGIIAAAYLISWLRQYAFFNNWNFGAWRFVKRFSEIVLLPQIVITLAILGLVAVTITGALGGTLVYGPNIDPVVHLVNVLLVR